MERRINRIIRDPSGRVIRSPETGGYALPEAYEEARNAVFLLKPLYPGEEPHILMSRFGEESRYVQRIFRQAFNRPAGVQIDPYSVPFSAEQKQAAFRALVETEGGADRLMTELEVACDDEAPHTERWEILDRMLQEVPGHPALVERLLRLLASDQVLLRLLACEALGYVGDSFAVPALLSALHDDSHLDVRAFAGLALGMLGVREARLPIARRALQTYDTGLRHDLFCALALLGGLGEDGPGFRLDPGDSVDGDADLRAVVLLSASEGLGGVAATLLDPDTPRGRRLACLSLLELTLFPDALPLLLALSTDHDDAVAAGALQIAALHTRRASNHALVQEAADVFRRVLEISRNARSRETAATILGRLGEASAVDLLDRRGMGDPDFLVRDAAVRSLRQLEDRVFGHHRVRTDADIGLWRR